MRLASPLTVPPALVSHPACADGWWATRLAGRRDLDLGHLRRVPLTRGLFAGPYRDLFHRHGRLFGRFRPFLERDRLRPYRGGGGGGFARGVGGLRGPSLRDMELATRIRIAEGTGEALVPFSSFMDGGSLTGSLS